MNLEKYGIYNFHQDEAGFVYAYTNGSWEGNGTAAACAGLGVYFGEGHALNAIPSFFIDSTKWLPGCKRNAWKLSTGEPVKHQFDLEELDRELADKSIEIKWNHVDAHCGILGNERADALAR
ncbi:ribonuclease H1 [Culex quinquefasciatus]|uniref:Ribonuclease H1 n=1 Tax=Culex quinquefasciatus TaxID=7176 RepID=B0XLW5_CULQU|nr:ribonuclease H1 [Culex quinquefasciatus]|eukprot:XP_001870636.1 ribonuclease H1 [Culex quinquefasciatus]